ncbi:sulfotransferase family protein [Frankia sp. B2]|nr:MULTISPECIES: sulfotransferase family protein [unclassified Frankia]KDA41575.1 hypothetical protein BMG523Draft_03577 [Frankia sp. BMG5.23]KEZ35067.1 hypothetical protein CEDDRAFT_03551 [Frankia sp. CeD]ORT49146.1 sulfotransferase family protein [Frankia sp. KB5]TFE25915.1 sulfotransferase family protein [Frankia sp. B2]
MINIIGAGFGRTGTLSLKLALEQLGYGPCHHMDEVLAHRETIAAWTSAAEGAPVDWDSLYGQYRSTVDWPGARFWRELADHYPSARVILTVRDPEKWYDSARSTLFQAISNRPARMSAEAMRVITMMNLVVWDGVFKGRFADKDHALQVFAEHNAAVQREISADRLLVFDVAQGWGPLCDFLGVPVPGEQFPRLNNREAYAAKHRERVVAAMSASGVQP